MVLETYPKIAAVERLRMERPCERTVTSAVGGIRRLCEMGGIALDEPISVLTRKRLDRILDAARKSELKPITLWSYIYALRAVFAKWTHPYYDDKQWKMPEIELPTFRRQAPRYIRPDSTVLARVKEWYSSLEKRPDPREWVLATLMLEFAMRNNDAERLRWSDFRPNRSETTLDYVRQPDSIIDKNLNRTSIDNEQDRVVLCYTPHKTRLTSGRTVSWPVHPNIWKKLCEYHDQGIPFNKRKGWIKNEIRDAQLVVPCARDIYVRLNKELRALKIFTGPKGCYELRKICIDHVYQKFGAEMASSISGDDIRTMLRYYADPSAVKINGVRIIDLL